MSETQLIDEQAELTMGELCRACALEADQVHVWVIEGMLEPAGERPEEWRFGGIALRRARIAKRLERDLQVNTAGVALAIELLDRIDALEARLRHWEE